MPFIDGVDLLLSENVSKRHIQEVEHVVEKDKDLRENEDPELIRQSDNDSESHEHGQEQNKAQSSQVDQRTALRQWIRDELIRRISMVSFIIILGEICSPKIE